MYLSELCSSCGYATVEDFPDVAVTGIACDTRAVKAGTLFVCLKGRRADGADYLPSAVEKGAVAAVLEGEVPEDLSIPCISVPDARAALACLSSAFYGEPQREMIVCGVTGTNGKTSVAYLLKAILERSGRKCGMIGTVHCYSGMRLLRSETADPSAHMTTPDPPELFRMLAEMRQDGCRYVVLEATSHASALKKLLPIRFDLLIFTNFTEDHLDFHRTMEEYWNAKRRLFGQAKTALLNIDDEAGAKLFQECKISGCSVYTLSEGHRESDFTVACPIALGYGGSRYLFRERAKKEEIPVRAFPVTLRVPGDYNRMNSAESIAAARLLGITPSEIRDAVYAFSGVPGRMEEVKAVVRSDIRVFIDFAHTPDAVEKVLSSALGLQRPGERLSVLFGCGGDRDPYKRSEMVRVASRYANRLYLTTDNSRSEDPEKILRDMLPGLPEGKDHRVILSREEAIKRAICEAEPGETLLLLGKGHETYQIDRNGTHYFSEKMIAQEALKERFRAKHRRGGKENR